MDTVKERWVSLNRLIETSKLKTQRKKKRMKMVEELWDNYKRCNISIMGIPEGEERKEQMQRIYSKWERVNTFSFHFFHLSGKYEAEASSGSEDRKDLEMWGEREASREGEEERGSLQCIVKEYSKLLTEANSRRLGYWWFNWWGEAVT